MDCAGMLALGDMEAELWSWDLQLVFCVLFCCLIPPGRLTLDADSSLMIYTRGAGNEHENCFNYWKLKQTHH